MPPNEQNQPLSPNSGPPPTPPTQPQQPFQVQQPLQPPVSPTNSVAQAPGATPPAPVSPQMPQGSSQQPFPQNPGMAPINPDPMGMPSDGQAKTRKLKGKVIKIIIGIVLVMVIGTIAAILLLGQSKKYSSADLTTYSEGTASFKHPESWEKIKGPSTAKVTIAESTELSTSHAAIVYSVTDIGLKESDKLTASDQADLHKQIKQSVGSSEIKAAIEKTVGCKSGAKLDFSDLKNESLTGQKLTFTCKNEKGVLAKVVAYFGMAKDNKLHTIEIDGLQSSWDLNEQIYISMLDSFTIK